MQKNGCSGKKVLHTAPISQQYKGNKHNTIYKTAITTDKGAKIIFARKLRLSYVYHICQIGEQNRHALAWLRNKNCPK